MNRTVKKALKITGISLASLLVAGLIFITIATHFVFTPAKITPVVLKAANEALNAQVSMESVELTFFSTFPELGLKVKQGVLVSKALHDSVKERRDSLLSFQTCVITISPMAYLRKNQIKIHKLTLDHASVYAFKDKTGLSNWDIVKASADTLTVQEDSTESSFNSDLDINNVELHHSNIVFDDRDTRIYARLDDANLKLKASLSKENSSLKLHFTTKNILFWQQGELLVNKVATEFSSDLLIDRRTHQWTLRETTLAVNGIKFDANGTLVRDTVAKTIDLNISYGLHAPSVETVLAMIPESVVKKNDVSAKGEVKMEGTLKGLYGDKQLPVASFKIQIMDASAKYAGLPYGIDHLSADFEAYVDLMRRKPSFLNLKIFRLQGAYTDVLADAKIDDLLTDPRITFNTKSVVDLNALAQTFPLQEGVIISGKLKADLHLNCRLSSIKKQDIGRISLNGDIDFEDFGLKNVNKGFNFKANACLRFSGDKTLQAQADVNSLMLNSSLLSSAIENLSATVTSSNPQDTTRIVALDCQLALNKLRVSMADSIALYSGKTTAKLHLVPSKADAKKPTMNLTLRTDSLFIKANGNKLSLDVAGFDVQATKVRDSVWTTSGTIGFHKLRAATPHFGLPIRMRDTKITLGNRQIILNNASLRLGKSNLTASGSVSNLAGAILKGEMLTARLSVTSNLIDCNQLINAFSFTGDSIASDSIAEESTDTLGTDSQMKLFVIPKNIDFELNTDIKKVVLDRLLFEQVHGAVSVKNQTVYLEDLSMRALDAEMKTVVVYRASNSKRGYAGFDFKLKDIKVGRLVEFMPSLDSIVPMLRSFKGTVDFDVAAEARLDSNMNIRIPTLKSAIHIRGDSLVLMDGETFAEISKMLMFKNKKENVFDSLSVNITVNDGVVKVYPFVVEIDRYRAAIGGEQGLDMNFNYHISILKSPLPFKAGVNITGNPDKMKFRIGKAKYKDAITPTHLLQVDSTRMNMGNEITRRFKQILDRRSSQRSNNRSTDKVQTRKKTESKPE